VALLLVIGVMLYHSQCFGGRACGLRCVFVYCRHRACERRYPAGGASIKAKNGRCKKEKTLQKEEAESVKNDMAAMDKK